MTNKVVLILIVKHYLRKLVRTISLELVLNSDIDLRLIGQIILKINNTDQR